MSKTFPQQLMMMARNPQVKKAILLEYPQEPGQCENCGGIGFISYFLATMGPFDSPGSGSLVSKFHDGKWWCAPGFIEPSRDKNKTNMKFGTVSDTCPICHGLRSSSHPVYVPMPEELSRKIKAVMAAKRIA